MALKKEKVKPLIAILMVIGFLSLIGALVFIPIPEGNRDIVNILIGAFIAAVIDIIKSYFQKGDI